MAHSNTCPMSFAYLPVASAWVVTFQNLLCTQTHPLHCYPPSHWLRLFSSQTFSRIYTPTFLKPSHFFIPTCLWRWNRQCCEMSAYKIQSWGITQKKAYNIQNMAKVWNQEKQMISLSLNMKILDCHHFQGKVWSLHVQDGMKYWPDLK
jgi:hypothetical protein